MVYLVTFHNISNPYEDPIEPMSPHPGRDVSYNQNPYQQQQSQEYANNGLAQMQAAVSSMPHPHSLHALSQAIELHTPPQANMLPRPVSNHDSPFEHTFDQIQSGVESTAPFTTPAMATANQALNTSTAMDPSIDPSLMSPPQRHEPPISNAEQMSQTTNATQTPQTSLEDADSETAGLGQKEAILLRHFSETPGRWCV